MTLAERAAQLRRAQAQLPGLLERAARDATIRAVEAATEMTPPTGGDLRGTNARTGEMKQHWATDSRTSPAKRGNEFVTELNNNVQYASFVNDGHRMDRHFVPGLVINPSSGLLEYNPDGRGGIVVGTRTAYVPGLYMTDRAKEVYRSTLHAQLAQVEELIR